jgi:hypothetical protein
MTGIIPNPCLRDFGFGQGLDISEALASWPGCGVNLAARYDSRM